MNVLVNGISRELTAPCSLSQLIKTVSGEESPSGVAVALNSSLILRDQWYSTPLSEGDHIEILQAVAGG